MRTLGLTIAISVLASAAVAQDKAAAPAAKPAEMQPPTLSPEGKKWVESMQGKWKANDMAMTMGDQKIAGKMTISCEKAAGGWSTLCKAKMDAKGMPPQEMSMMLGWDMAEATATCSRWPTPERSTTTRASDRPSDHHVGPEG
jgi:hypothetical protein